jgi:hypothetical protein
LKPVAKSRAMILPSFLQKIQMSRVVWSFCVARPAFGQAQWRYPHSIYWTPYILTNLKTWTMINFKMKELK